ncbi:MAG: hypothetical protein GY795_32310 [Desulfobacterales bacterium]|nr:hypothetical protein [Desulfobacterales bacterium]
MSRAVRQPLCQRRIIPRTYIESWIALPVTISLLGHTDMLCIADAGLPIPGNANRIDLALIQGIPI